MFIDFFFSTLYKKKSPDTNQIRSFKPTGVAPVRLFGHTAVYDGSDGILVYGGYSPLNARAATSSKLLYIYWVNDKTWSSLRAGPEARAFHTAYMIPNTPLMAVIGGNLLNGLSSYTSSVLLYDTSCNTWTTSTPGGIALQSRYSHTSVVLNNGILFIFGGFRGSVLSDLSVLTTRMC